MICAICSKEHEDKYFAKHLRRHSMTSQEYYNTYLKKENEGICLTCKEKPTTYIGINDGYREYCSKKCSFNSSKVKEKIEKTNLEKYGVTNASKSKILMEKREKTCEAKYGAKNVFQSKDVKDTIKKTFKENWGDHPSRIKEVRKRIETTFQENHGAKDGFSKINNDAFIESLKYVNEVLDSFNYALIDEYTGRRKDSLKIKCLNCNTVFNTCIEYLVYGYGKCPKCFPKSISACEKEIFDFIKYLGIEAINQDRTAIKPLELDIYIPDKKIAIEYNGLYWHSEKNGRDKNYHLNKLNECEKKGVRLIQIFEDEWRSKKQNVIKYFLKKLLGILEVERIHARKCTIKEIDTNIKKIFLNKYHLMEGKDNSKIRLGAFYNQELIAVMCFSHGNPAKGTKYIENVWDLTRFCTNYSYHIPGAASKLLTYFKRNYEWEEIYSYADRRWSVGNLYYKLGFTLKRTSRPNYWYTKGHSRLYRFEYRKKYDDPKGIPEQIMRAKEGYYRIWGCGTLKFVLYND